jgi:hypothetical protein
MIKNKIKKSKRKKKRKKEKTERKKKGKIIIIVIKKRKRKQKNMYELFYYRCSILHTARRVAICIAICAILSPGAYSITTNYVKKY